MCFDVFCAGPVISHGFIILAMLGGLTQEGWVHTEGLTGNDLGLSSHVFIFFCAAELESPDGAMGTFRRGTIYLMSMQWSLSRRLSSEAVFGFPLTAFLEMRTTWQAPPYLLERQHESCQWMIMND